MELGGAALTALFVGLVWTLIKVVEFFINSKKNGKVAKVEAPAPALTAEQARKLEQISTMVSHLNELHSVYDENHVPKWYVPGELLTLLRNARAALESLSNELEDSMDKSEAGQKAVLDKMSDLINSQKLMTERLGDLITLWSKLGNSK
jgi:hypothetical protein